MDALGAAVSGWFPTAPEVLSLLTSHPDLWMYTALPLVASILGVNLFFRHFRWFVWTAVKAGMAVMVYTQVRGVMLSHLGPDPLNLESAVFGVPAGTLYLSASLGLHVAKTRAAAALASACPACLPAAPAPAPPPPLPAWSPFRLLPAGISPAGLLPERLLPVWLWPTPADRTTASPGRFAGWW